MTIGGHAKTASPALFFDSEKIVEMRAACNEGMRRTFLNRMIHAADACLDSNGAYHLDYKAQKRDIWWTRNGIFTVTTSLMALASAFLFSGRENYGRAAVEATLTIIRDGIADRTSKCWGNAYPGWRHDPFHDKAKLSQALSWVYDFCWELFSSSEREEFILFAKESIAIARKHWRQDWNFISSNMGIRGVLAGFWYRAVLSNEIPIEELDPEMPSFDEELRAIEYFFNMSLDSDGAPFEGPDYASCAIPFVASAAWVMARKGLPNLLTNRNYQRLLEYFLYELVPSRGRINNLNDADCWGVYSVAGHLPLMGTKAGALLPWLAERIDFASGKAGEGAFSNWLTGKEPCILDHRTENLFYFLLWWRNDVTVTTPKEIGYRNARHFRGRGVVSMRTGWGENDMLFTHFAGMARYRCHRQGDVNHISWYAGAESILIDAGYGNIATADSTAALDHWFGKTAAHNTVLINGEGQYGEYGKPGWPVAEILDFKVCDDYFTSLGDASQCYGYNHGIEQCLRRTIFLPKPFDTLIVVDFVKVNGAVFTADFLWHTHANHQMEIVEEGWKIHTLHKTAHFLQLEPDDCTVSSSSNHGLTRLKITKSGRELYSIVVASLTNKNEPPLIQANAMLNMVGDYEITVQRKSDIIKITAPVRFDGVERNPVQVTVEI